MGKLIELKCRSTRNLYIVDDFYVVLVLIPEEAISYIQAREESNKALEARLLDDQKEISVIKSGKVEIVLWEREPRPLERLSFKINVRDFIEQHLKRFSTPYSIDVLEDRGAESPKK
ncbi:hypothetical protein [Brevibacillus porteri]|uniref:hypothetical protein n=1 Tax=Brevibacillus porteri TaxID=2126350 RepID=UPI00363F78C4